MNENYLKIKLKNNLFYGKITTAYIFSVLFLLFLFIYSLSLGPVSMHLDQALQSFFNSSNPLQHKIIVETRLPRTIIGCLSGACLALAGVILQYATKNPMACPSLLGINQGCLFAILITLVVFPFCPTELYLISAVVGGILSALLTYFVTLSIGVSKFRLILVGQTINALLFALCQAILVYLPTRSGNIMINLNGSLSSSSWKQLNIIGPILFVVLVFTFLNFKKIQIISLGKEIANSLGIKPNRALLMLLFFSVVLCAGSVSLVGPIFFFPLIAVYFSKIIVGDNPYHLVPFTLISGAILMLLADCLMRQFYPIQELPLGIFIAIIGAPVLVLSSRIKENLNND